MAKKSTGDLGKMVERLDRIERRIGVLNQGMPKGLRLKIRDLVTKEKLNPDIIPFLRSPEFTCGCCVRNVP